MENHLNKKNLIIQKSDKGNLAVVFDRSTNNKKMKSMPSDLKKIIEVDLMTYSNFSINQEKQLDRFLKSLNDKKTISSKISFFKTKRNKTQEHVWLK